MRKLVRLILLGCYDINENNNDETMAKNRENKGNNIKRENKEIENDVIAEEDDKEVEKWKRIQLYASAQNLYKSENQRSRSKTIPLYLEVEKQTRRLSFSEKCAYKQLNQELDDKTIFTTTSTPVQVRHTRNKTDKKLSRNEKQVLRRVMPLTH